MARWPLRGKTGWMPVAPRRADAARFPGTIPFIHARHRPERA